MQSNVCSGEKEMQKSQVRLSKVSPTHHRELTLAQARGESICSGSYGPNREMFPERINRRNCRQCVWTRDSWPVRSMPVAMPLGLNQQRCDAEFQRGGNRPNRSHLTAGIPRRSARSVGCTAEAATTARLDWRRWRRRRRVWAVQLALPPCRSLPRPIHGRHL